MVLRHSIVITILTCVGFAEATELVQERSDQVIFQGDRIQIHLARPGTVALRAYDAQGRVAGAWIRWMASGDGSIPAPWGRSKRILFVRVATPLGSATTAFAAGSSRPIQLGSARLGEMRLVPGGSYTIGSPSDESGRYDDEIRHLAILSPFWIDSSEVLRSDFRHLMGYDPPPDSCRGNCPASNVNWAEAVLYCNARSLAVGRDTAYRYSRVKRDSSGSVASLEELSLDTAADGYRLPTEAQREVATRAGNPAAWPWGADSTAASTHAWFAGNAAIGPMPASSRPPNAWGLRDMAGNLWEWVQDWYGSYGAVIPVDPINEKAGTYRAMRGGAWNSPVSQLRCAFRNGADPGLRSQTIGFRCARPDR